MVIMMQTSSVAGDVFQSSPAAASCTYSVWPPRDHRQPTVRLLTATSPLLSVYGLLPPGGRHVCTACLSFSILLRVTINVVTDLGLKIYIRSVLSKAIRYPVSLAQSFSFHFLLFFSIFQGILNTRYFRTSQWCYHASPRSNVCK